MEICIQHPQCIDGCHGAVPAAAPGAGTDAAGI